MYDILTKHGLRDQLGLFSQTTHNLQSRYFVQVAGPGAIDRNLVRT